MRGARLGSGNWRRASHYIKDNGGRIESFLSVKKDEG